MAADVPFDPADRRSRLGAGAVPGDRFGALQAWILGLPWVVRGHTGTDVPHHIVIDCAPLHFRHVWIVVVADPDREDPDLFVVVPLDLTRVARGLNWFTGVVPLEDGRSLCRVDLERDDADIELVLLATYGMMFPGAVEGDAA